MVNVSVCVFEMMMLGHRQTYTEKKKKKAPQQTDSGNDKNIRGSQILILNMEAFFTLRGDHVLNRNIFGVD